jgi:hypothetical protein
MEKTEKGLITTFFKMSNLKPFKTCLKENTQFEKE